MTQDKTQLELEFHWLARPKREATARMDLLNPPDSTRGRIFSRDDAEVLMRNNFPSTPTYIETGTKFIMTTDDPVNKPLPDPELFELQWHLQCVCSMRGAADWPVADFEDRPEASIDPLRAVDQTSETMCSVNETPVNAPPTELPAPADFQRLLGDVQGDDDPAQTRPSSLDGSFVDGPSNGLSQLKMPSVAV